MSSLSPATKYYFVVRAKDQAGNIDTNKVEVNATTTAVSFANSVEPIFAANCAKSGCHTGAKPAEGLNLSTASAAYAGLVMVFSIECSVTYLVAPSAPTMSYLMWKLQGTGPCFSGSQMPKGSPPLSATDQATISSWIAEGAPNN